MKRILSILYWLDSFAELEACRRRIRARRIADRKWRHERQRLRELSDRENLEADIARIGGDFDKALENMTHGK